MLNPDLYDVRPFRVDAPMHSAEPAVRTEPRGVRRTEVPPFDHPPRRDRRELRYSITAFDDVETDIRKDWTIDGLIGAGELSVWFGAPGDGKSVAIMDAALHVAAGLPWHDRPTRRGAVLYIAAERRALVERRVAAWRKRHGLKGLPFGIVAGRFDFCTSATDAEAVIELAADWEHRTGLPVALIIVDTKARTMGGGDENAARDMARYVDHVARIQAETGAHVAIVDHVPHDAPNRMRGHGALLGAADTTIRVAKTESGLRTLSVDKVNDGEAVSLAFNIESEVVGRDPVTGQDTTAAVAVATTPPDKTRTSANVRLTDAEALALRTLNEALADIGHDPPPSTIIPPKVKVVSEQDWRSLCYSRQIAGSDEQGTKQKAFKRAAEGLQRKGMIGVHEGRVWTAR